MWWKCIDKKNISDISNLKIINRYFDFFVKFENKNRWRIEGNYKVVVYSLDFQRDMKTLRKNEARRWLGNRTSCAMIELYYFLYLLGDDHKAGGFHTVHSNLFYTPIDLFFLENLLLFPGKHPSLSRFW